MKWVADRTGRLVNLDHVESISMEPLGLPVGQATHEIIAISMRPPAIEGVFTWFRLLVGTEEHCQDFMDGIRRRLNVGGMHGYQAPSLPIGVQR